MGDISGVGAVTCMSATAPGSTRSSQISMQITLPDKEVEKRINEVVNAESGRTKGGAMCSQISAWNMNRIRKSEEDGGCNPTGPPFTSPTGIGWDTSTEAKDQAG